jgi:hypothetical protein
MRPGEFWEAMKVWQADKEADRRHVAEVIRGVGVRLFNIQLKPKDQIRDIRKFLPLPWDDKDNETGEIDRLNNLSIADKAAEAQALLERLKLK